MWRAGEAREPETAGRAGGAAGPGWLVIVGARLFQCGLLLIHGIMVHPLIFVSVSALQIGSRQELVAAASGLWRQSGEGGGGTNFVHMRNEPGHWLPALLWVRSDPAVEMEILCGDLQTCGGGGTAAAHAAPRRRAPHRQAPTAACHRRQQ